MINIVLIAGENVVSQGICHLLNSEKEFEVLGEVSSHAELFQISSNGNVDVVVIDQDELRRTGISLIKKIQNEMNVKILLLTEPSETVLAEYFRLGIDAFVCKDSALRELAFAIKQIYGGGRYVCTNLVLPILDNYVQIGAEFAGTELTVLTSREKEILALMSEGYTNQEIADKLFTSKRTVEGHRQNLINKTGSRNTASLIRFAFNNNLLDGAVN